MFRAVIIRLLMAALVLLSTEIAASAQTIVNQADASWSIGERSFATQSNLVEITVAETPEHLQAKLSLTKLASKTEAAPGDVVYFTVTIRNRGPGVASHVRLVDEPSPWFLPRLDSIRVNGAPPQEAVALAATGDGMIIPIGTIRPGDEIVVTYAMTVRADAPSGRAPNHASVTDQDRHSERVTAWVRISRDTVASRMTILGRIVAGECSDTVPLRGVAGVRVMLEDGSFAITDAEGRYHFDGVVPGTHVVQAQVQTLPPGSSFLACSESTRSAGSASSRFVVGQGGSLVTADFYATLPSGQPSAEPDEEALTDRAAAGAEMDWLALGDGPADWLFPTADHNPRAPAIRVAIRHEAGQAVTLYANGKAVDALSFDGVQYGPRRAWAVSVWRGVPLESGRTKLEATISDADGTIATELTRDVHFSSAPMKATFVEPGSRLIADGTNRPVLAVRFTDRAGRPVRSGVSGRFEVNAPYESARAIDSAQISQVSVRGERLWTVEGDDGIARIELAPTMVSGAVRLDFVFQDGEVTRKEQLELWMVPGEQKWTLIGLAEVALGSDNIASNMQGGASFDSDLGDHARTAFYAKGRVLGRFLLTVAYDSAKQEDDQRLLGTIDPAAYYTVYADRAERQFDAASRENLYLRVESSAFYALYGDFETGFDQTELARYYRAATGLKGEARLGAVRVDAFAAQLGSRHQRDEFQGNGLSGPYPLSSRTIIPNSERVAIEVRDRFRSERIIERRELVRFTDYDLDLLSGSIRFREPVLSRDFDLNPRFIVVDYEVDQLEGDAWTGGVRVDHTLAGGRWRIGGTAISEQADGPRSTLVAADVEGQLGDSTEVRAEVAVSTGGAADAVAWMAEIEHHDGQLDLLAYARSVEAGYAVGQLAIAERGRRKVGADARLSLDERSSIVASVWRDDSLIDMTRRNAAQLQAIHRGATTDLRAGIAYLSDRLADGDRATSTVLEVGVTRRMLGNRLELSSSSSIALDDAESVDLPTRHRFGARYALSSNVKLVGLYELAKGNGFDAHTLRAGVDLTPWAGGRVSTALGQQGIAELGQRTFAAFGVAQSFPINASLSLDATVDGNWTLGGADPSRLVNYAHPATSGGHLGVGAELFEDFLAVTFGGSYRQDLWSASLRAEYRDGALINRAGVVFGAIRQIGEGSVLGSGFTWTRAEGIADGSSEVFEGLVSAAFRPANVPLAVLTKLEYRGDMVKGSLPDLWGTRVLPDQPGQNLQSRRLIASLSSTWSPGNAAPGRTEFGVFVAARYNFDSQDSYSLSGHTGLIGLDVRLGLTERVDVGGRLTVRSNLGDGGTAYSFGPQLGFSPAAGLLVAAGYNIAGYDDPDFGEAQTTRSGPFVSLKVKIDDQTLSSLGIGL